MSLLDRLEMRPERLIRKIIQAQYRVENPSLRDIQNARPLLEEVPLYFGHSYKFQNAEELLQALREAISRYGIELLSLTICTSLQVGQGQRSTVSGNTGFKLLAEEAEIPIVVIAQPRKRENGGSEIMTAEDVKYSSSIHSDCDQMIILHRKRIVSKPKDVNIKSFEAKQESMDPVTLVRVEAHRYGPGGEAVLFYKGAESRFALAEIREPIRVVSKEASYK